MIRIFSSARFLISFSKQKMMEVLFI